MQQTSQTQLKELRGEFQGEKELLIRQMADQAAERNVLQKQVRQLEADLGARARDLELQTKEKQLVHERLEDEAAQRKQKEKELLRLRDLNVGLEKRIEELFARTLMLEDAAEDQRERYESRTARLQRQLGDLDAASDVHRVLYECVTEVVRLAEVDKARVVVEERNGLRDRLGELLLKVSTLPDFYQRQVFCSDDPTPDFFEAITADTGGLVQSLWSSFSAATKS